MYAVAKRTTGTWSFAERCELTGILKKEPRQAVKHFRQKPQYLIILRKCRAAWIASAIQRATQIPGEPYRLSIRDARKLFVSRPMLGLPPMTSDGKEGEKLDVPEIIRRFEEELKRPAPRPRLVYTRVHVEHTPRPWDESCLDVLLRSIAGRSGFGLLYRREEKPECFTLPKRVAWSRVDELIHRVIQEDGSTFGYAVVRSSDDPETAFGPAKRYDPISELSDQEA